MRDVFTVNGDGAVPMMKKLMSSVSDVGLVTLIRDAWKGCVPYEIRRALGRQ